MTLEQGVSAAAQATELGELFEYAISTPVSLARQKSAMLPIVNEAVEGAKVSIYNQRVHAKHPLHGIRLRNATALHLLQDPSPSSTVACMRVTPVWRTSRLVKNAC